MVMAYDVFISYSRYDTEVVDEFVATLEAEGFSVWIDRDGIESGEAFKRVILRAIKESQVVLFFSSEHSNQSDWTAKEIGVAVKYKKHIIPIKLDDSNFNEDVEFDLINLDFVDYADDSKRTGMKERMLKTLRNKLGKGKIGSKVREEVEYERFERENIERKRTISNIIEGVARRNEEIEEKEKNRQIRAKYCEGALNGLFSVSPTKKVLFSKGNLQYQISTGVWKFADCQFNFLGGYNRKIIFRKRDRIDLFGWGTGNNPANCSSNNILYYTFEDWGMNRISNGGNQPNLWRTLTSEEWKWLFYNRTTPSRIRFAKACVNSVKGILLLPDNWDESTCRIENWNKETAPFMSNVIGGVQWATMEKQGAVFLPAAGMLNDGFLHEEGSYGYYWSSTPNGAEKAYHLYFFDGHTYAVGNRGERGNGFSVRLVCPAE